jgi:hypothetical protein
VENREVKKKTERKEGKKQKSRNIKDEIEIVLERTRRIRSIKEEARFNWLQTSLQRGERKDSRRRNDGTCTGITLLWIMSG